MQLQKRPANAVEYYTGEALSEDDEDRGDCTATGVSRKLARTTARAGTLSAQGHNTADGSPLDARQLQSQPHREAEIIRKDIRNVYSFIGVESEHGLLRIKPVLLNPDVREVFRHLPLEVDLSVVVDGKLVVIGHSSQDSGLKAHVTASHHLNSGNSSCLVYLSLHVEAFLTYVGYQITRYTAESPGSTTTTGGPQLTLYLKSPAVQQQLHKGPALRQQEDCTLHQQATEAVKIIDNAAEWTTFMCLYSTVRGVPSNPGHRPKVHCPQQLCLKALPAVFLNKGMKLKVTLFKDGAEVKGVDDTGTAHYDAGQLCKDVIVTLGATTNHVLTGCRVEKLRAKPPNLLQVYLTSAPGGRQQLPLLHTAPPAAAATAAEDRQTVSRLSPPPASLAAKKPSLQTTPTAAAGAAAAADYRLVTTSTGASNTGTKAAAPLQVAAPAPVVPLQAPVPPLLYSGINLLQQRLACPLLQPLLIARHPPAGQQQQLQGSISQQLMAIRSLPWISITTADRNKQSAAAAATATAHSHTTATGSVAHTAAVAAAVNQLRVAAAAARSNPAACAGAPEAAAAASQSSPIDVHQGNGTAAATLNPAKCAEARDAAATGGQPSYQRLAGADIQPDMHAGPCHCASNTSVRLNPNPQHSADLVEGMTVAAAQATGPNPSYGMAAAVAPYSVSAATDTALPPHADPNTQAQIPAAQAGSVKAASAAPAKLTGRCHVLSHTAPTHNTSAAGDQADHLPANLAQQSADCNTRTTVCNVPVIVINDSDDDSGDEHHMLCNKQQSQHPAVKVKHEQCGGHVASMVGQQHMKAEQQTQQTASQALAPAAAARAPSAPAAALEDVHYLRDAGRKHAEEAEYKAPALLGSAPTPAAAAQGTQAAQRAPTAAAAAAAARAPPPCLAAVAAHIAAAQLDTAAASSVAAPTVDHAAAVTLTTADPCQLPAASCGCVAGVSPQTGTPETNVTDMQYNRHWCIGSAPGVNRVTVKLEPATAACKLDDMLPQAFQQQAALTPAAAQRQTLSLRPTALTAAALTPSSGAATGMAASSVMAAVRQDPGISASAAKSPEAAVGLPIGQDQLATLAPATGPAVAVKVQATTADSAAVCTLPADFTLTDCTGDILLAGRQLTDLLDHLHAPDYQVMQLNDYIISLSHHIDDDNRVVRFWFDYSQIRLWVRRRNEQQCRRLVQQMLAHH